MNVLIDPFVYAFPEGDFEAATFRSYLTSLSLWNNRLLRRDSSLFTLELVLNRLMDENRFPDTQTMRELYRRFDIVDIPLPDVLSLLSVLATTRPFLEDKVEMRGVVLGDDCHVTPSSIVERLGQGVGEMFKDAIFLAAHAADIGNILDDVCIGTKDRESLFENQSGNPAESNEDRPSSQLEKLVSARVVRVSGTVELVDYERDGIIGIYEHVT